MLHIVYEITKKSNAYILLRHQLIYMQNESDESTTKIAEVLEDKQPIEITDERFEEELQKRLGVKSSDVVKKVEVITEDQQKVIEAKEKEDDIKFGLEKGLITTKEYEEYIQTLSEDKVELARKKFIKENPELNKAKATEIFNSIIRNDEDDEIEDGEDMVPNSEKLAANKMVTDIVEKENENKFGKFKTLAEKRKEFLSNEKVEKENTELIMQVVKETPKRFEMEVGGIKFGVNVTDEDIEEANQMVLTGAAKKGLTKEGVAANIQAYIQTKKSQAIIEEGVKVLVAAELDANKRGVKGIIDDKGKVISGVSPKMKKMMEMGYIPT